MIDFLKLSFLKLENDKNKIEIYSQTLVNENQDSFLLRHYHPTIPILYWNLFISKNYKDYTTKIRLSSLIILGASFLITL